MDLKSINQQGGRLAKIYELNEPQATLLITYLDNNEVVRKFKKELIKQFYQMRTLLLNGGLIQHPAPPVDFLEACGVIKPEPPEPTDEEVARQFLTAIQQALESGEYYLLYKHCRKPAPRDGTLLGVYDGDIVTLISSRAYGVYKQPSNHYMRIKTLWDKLIGSGLALPRTEADRNTVVRGNSCCVIRIQRQTANAMMGRSLPLLAANM